MDTSLVRYPTVRFRSLRTPGLLDIVLEEPFHYGTDATGWIYRYYVVDKKGDFSPLISIEWVWADRIVETTMVDSAREENALLTRNLSVIGQNGLRLDTQLERPQVSTLLCFLNANSGAVQPFSTVLLDPSHERRARDTFAARRANSM